MSVYMRMDTQLTFSIAYKCQGHICYRIWAVNTNIP